MVAWINNIMQVQHNQQQYNSIRKYCFDYKITHLLAAVTLLVISNYVAFALPVNKEAEAKKVFKEAIWELNNTNGSINRFNDRCNRIVILTKSDFDLQQQMLAESFSQVSKLLKSKEYVKAQELLSLALRLDQSNDAIKNIIALKAKLGEFDYMEPVLMQHFASSDDKSWWHFNLSKAEILTYTAKICEKYSNNERAEHFYRLAIQQTTQPIPSIGLDEWDSIADKSYYWSRMYAQARLGLLLINSGNKDTGIPILSTVKNGLEHDHLLAPNANPESKSYYNNLIAWMFELEWKKNRDKTYTALGMVPKDSPVL